MKDNYFDEMDIKLPYTEAAVAHKVKTYRGSVAAYKSVDIIMIILWDAINNCLGLVFRLRSTPLWSRSSRTSRTTTPTTRTRFRAVNTIASSRRCGLSSASLNWAKAKAFRRSTRRRWSRADSTRYGTGLSNRWTPTRRLWRPVAKPIGLLKVSQRGKRLAPNW